MAQAKDKISELIIRIRKNAFDLDADANLQKEGDLLLIKMKTEKKLFDLDERFKHEMNKLRIDEEFQKQGKNAETRIALMELEFAGTDYDSIPELKMLLRMVASVQMHNNTVMDLFFRSGK